MTRITDADRRAAQDLRVVLADISGFWHAPGDDSPLVLALARHRREAEERVTDKLVPLFPATAVEPAAAGERPRRPAGLPRAGTVKLSA